MTRFAIIAGLIIFLCLAELWLWKTAYQSGENSMELFYQKRIAENNKEADQRLSVAQGDAIAANDEYNEAINHEQARTAKLSATIDRLRSKRDVCSNDSNTPDYAPYIVFNEAASSEYLEASNDFRIPDEEADGLDVIQYSVSEYNRVAIHAIGLIETLEAAVKNGCVKVAKKSPDL